LQTYYFAKTFPEEHVGKWETRPSGAWAIVPVER
jgi:hypothetical protein